MSNINTASDLSPELLDHAGQSLGLRHGAHGAVEHDALGGVGLRHASLTMPRITQSGTSSPRSMNRLASRPSGVPCLRAARSTSPVASFGIPSRRATRPPAFPSRARLAEQHDDHETLGGGGSVAGLAAARGTAPAPSS